MADPLFRADQWQRRFDPHVAPVNRYVDEIRTLGRGWVPYVAPIHGGVQARVLSILRDPGPATRDGTGSGFICVENNDGSAALQADLLDTVGVSPFELLPWNAYPWYINRAPRAPELDQGVEALVQVIDLMPELRVVLLQGRDSQKAWRRLVRCRPAAVRGRDLLVIETYHPSPQALFARDADERQRRIERRVAAFRELAEALS